MSEADRALIEDARSGDNRAFEALVGRHQRAAYAVALRMLGSHQEADDVAQQTFVKAFESLHKYRGDGSFKSWVLTICVNLCRNEHRGRKRSEPLMITEEVADDGAAAPGDQLDREKRSRLLRTAIGQLPEKQRLAVELRIYQELSFAEVAKVMGGTENTAKVNYHHGVNALRSLLAQEEAA